MHYKKYAEIPHEEKWNGFTLDYKYIEGFSPLFYETEGTHWDLDNDADVFLLGIAKNYWLNDFISPESFYVNILLDRQESVEKQRKDHVENSDFYRHRTLEDELNDIISWAPTTHPDKDEMSRLTGITEDISGKIDRFIPSLLREIILAGYVYEGPIDKQAKHEDTPYNRAIIREPGKYLYHYFNDQMVFDNYVQLITETRLDPSVEKLLDSGVLLEPIDRDRFFKYDLDKVIEVVEDNFQGWWT